MVNSSKSNSVFTKISHNNFKITAFNSASDLKNDIALRIKKIVDDAFAKKEFVNLGLATGNTPIGVYDLLAEWKLDWSYVRLFQIDEYCGIPNTATQSFRRFLIEYILSRNPTLKGRNCFFLDSNLNKKEFQFALKYHLGQLKHFAPDGLDYLLLGVGENGHLICAEPGSCREEEITFCPLHETTAAGAAASFYDREDVPTHWGGFSLKTIMNAKQVDAMILGEKKAGTLANIVLGDDTEEIPASILRHHKNASILSDVAAIVKLPQIQQPHRFKDSPKSLTNWDDTFCVRRALSWASFETKTRISQLSKEQLNGLGLEELTSKFKDTSKLCLSVDECYRNLISGKPGDYFYPGVAPKNAPAINIISPHPDDDVIALGGLIKILTSLGYKVNVIYGVGGNIAVSHKTLKAVLADKELLKEVVAYAEDPDAIDVAKLETDVLADLKNWDRYHDAYKKSTRQLSGLIRRKEATEAAMHCGVKKENIYFADFRFYQTGTVLKRPPGKKDFQKAYELICKLGAGIDIAAGDVSDPNGTHGKVLSIFKVAWKRYDEDRAAAGLPKRKTFLYRVAWATWPMHVCSLVVPIKQGLMDLVQEATLLHKSQCPLRFQGTDKLGIEERAEKVRKDNASQLKKLGVLDPEYIGAEVLVEWDCESELSLVV